MKRNALRLFLLVSAVVVGLGGLSPKPASAAFGVCNYYCLDPELTCCITCHWMGGSCVCPEFCTVE
jgi:hypothetical protein